MDETPGELRDLRALIVEGRGAMSAPEFVAFWGAGRPAALSINSVGGSAPPTPVDVWLAHGRLYASAGSDCHDLATRVDHPRCVITTGNDAYHAAIVFGVIQEDAHDPQRRVCAGRAPGWSLDPGVGALILPTRIYASCAINRSGRHDLSTAQENGAFVGPSEDLDAPNASWTVTAPPTPLRFR